MVDVTFQVDMSEVTLSSAVYLNYSLGGVVQAIERMPFQSGSSVVYEITLSIEQGTAVSYAFASGNTSNDVETVPVECATNGMRYLDANDTMTADLVCFGSCTVCIPTNINAPISSSEVVLKANPSSQLELHFNTAGTYQVQVLNVTGSLLCTVQVNASDNSSAVINKVAQLSKGMYLVNISSNRSSKVLRWIKQ